MQNKNENLKFISNIIGYAVLTITILMLLFFLVIPVGIIVIKAFFYNGHFTLEYFKLLFANNLQTVAIWNSLKIAIATTILTTLLSLPLAIINAKWSYKAKGLFSGLILLPMVMPPFVGAIGIKMFFSRHGSVNLLLSKLGILNAPIDWFSDDHMIWAVIFLEVFHLYPIMYLNLTAALANIDPCMEEMAATLGVPKWKQYKDIIIPLARPGYFAGAIIVFIWALTDLGTPLLVGFFDTMQVKIFTLVTDVNENPAGFALVFIVIVLTMGIFLLSKFLIRGQKYQMLSRGHVANIERKPGTLGSILIYILMIGTVLIALIPHVSVLITSLSDRWFMTILPEHYTLNHFNEIFNTHLSVIGIKNSLFYASASSVLDLILGVLIAYIVVRKLIPFSNFLDSLVMVPLALPGIVLAFGLVVTYSGTFLDPFINPVPLLIIAYAIRRLPYMVRSAAAGLQQTSASLEEASATFGATRFYTIRKIIVPLVTANLIAGGLLCFAYAMLDVSDSMILAMKDQFYPLTKAIYSLFVEQGNGVILASALGIVGMLILTACILGAASILGKKMGELFRTAG